MGDINEKMREIAVSEGMRIAEKFFAKRKNPTEVHVDMVTFAGMLAIAYEQGIAFGIVVMDLARV